jgi:hypothetical protein
VFGRGRVEYLSELDGGLVKRNMRIEDADEIERSEYSIFETDLQLSG